MSDRHIPRKRFGQHFLIDASIIEHIIQAIDPATHRSLVEIGPGRGALTLPLLEYGIDMHLIEIDRDLVQWWRQRQREGYRITVHEADVLAFDFKQLGSPAHPIHLIGNLPYNISTPLFFHLIDFHPIIATMCFMVQKEVADRICAEPGQKSYGQLSVWLQLHYQVEKLFDVLPRCFSPPPKVDSSVIRLQPHTRPPVAIDDNARFHEFIKAAFTQKRKTLRNNLKNLLSVEQIETAGIDPGRRAETLSLAEFAVLYKQLESN